MRVNKYFIVIAGAQLLFLICLEAIVRFFILPLPVIEDPVLGYRRAPQMSLISTEENDHPVPTIFNRQGFRGDDFSTEKQDGVFRVAILGDSFVEANAVELERTFPQLSEELWRSRRNQDAEFLNFGVSGYSPIQEFLLLRDEVFAYNPDAVVFFFFPVNDIEALSPLTSFSKTQPFASLGSDGGVKVDLSFATSTTYFLKRVITFLRRHSALFNLLYERFYLLKTAIYQKKFHPAETIPAYLTLCTSTPDPVMLNNYLTTKAIFREATNLCRSRGVPLYIVLVDHDGMLPDQSKKFSDIAPSFDYLGFEHDLMRAAQRDGYSFIGLQSRFRDLSQDGKNVFHWQHWNYEGHKVVAQVLVDRFAEDFGSLPKPL